MEYPVVFASDNGCALGLGVAVYSLLRHSSQTGELSLYILDGGISTANRKLIAGMADECHVPVQFIDMRGRFADSRIDHLSEVSYYRLQTADVLPLSVERALYVDTDVLFLDSVDSLFRHDLRGLPVGAVCDTIMMQGRDASRFSGSLGMKRDSPYFNAGVLLMDLKAWRAEGLVEQCLNYERGNRSKLVFHDQDVLNVVMEGRVSWLHPRWNMFDYLTYEPVRQRLKRRLSDPYTADQLDEAALIPAIIHYTGRKKPWHYYNKCHCEAAYLKAWAMSPWRDYGQSGFTWGRAWKKNVRKWRMKVFKNWD